MSIQWYPGHMNKARRAIAEAMPIHDVVIEVLDARMPRASENPVVAELRGAKPALKVLNKSDLADPAVTDAWLRHFEEKPRGGGEVAAIALRATVGAEARKIVLDRCRRLAPHRPDTGIKAVRCMIVGIPNVGKSTLINALVNRHVAKVGDEPAVTKSVQRVVLESGIVLSDNPGILWPKIEDEAGSYRLAFGGAIPDTAIDYESVALFGARYLLARYPDLLVRRYKLDPLPPDPTALLREIGRRRGSLRAGGVVDMHKAAGVLLHDFRSGALGRISLEAPGRDGGADDGDE